MKKTGTCALRAMSIIHCLNSGERFQLSAAPAMLTAARIPPPRSAICMVRTPPNELPTMRSEEHTSELQSRRELVCRLLLEKKNCRRGVDLLCCHDLLGWTSRHRLRSSI